MAENGGQMPTITATCGKTYSALSTPTRTGYQFDGWYTKPSGGIQITNSTSVLGGHICLYAHWSAAGHVHSYTKVVVPPTCDSVGYTIYTCSCGSILSSDIKASLGHNFGNWTVTIAPTCTESGEETRCCSRCGLDETRETDALGHNYVAGKCTRCGAYNNPFTDVAEGSAYYDAVMWGTSKGIVSGFTATEFRPNNTCTRAQVVTFLWRAAGSPEPTSANNPFSDVSAKQASGKDNPFYKAILWGVEKGITSGYSDGTFRPNATVTRGQFVTFLWRYECKPTSSTELNFNDANTIAKGYRDAVAWGVENGVIAGYGDNTFRPNNTCTRWQVVTFMYRDMADK